MTKTVNSFLLEYYILSLQINTILTSEGITPIVAVREKKANRHSHFLLNRDVLII